MTHPYIRMDPEPEEQRRAALISAGLAAAVGLVSFYFVRLFLSRESMDWEPERVEEGPRGGG